MTLTLNKPAPVGPLFGSNTVFRIELEGAGVKSESERDAALAEILGRAISVKRIPISWPLPDIAYEIGAYSVRAVESRYFGLIDGHHLPVVIEVIRREGARVFMPVWDDTGRFVRQEELGGIS